MVSARMADLDRSGKLLSLLIPSESALLRRIHALALGSMPLAAFSLFELPSFARGTARMLA